MVQAVAIVKVLVCGGRNFTDRALLEQALDEWLKVISKLIVGYDPVRKYPKGTDEMAYNWAIKRCIPYQCYPADWGKHGRSAGPIRNTQMRIEGKPDLVMAFEGGKGTKNMVEQAIEAKIPLVQIRRVTSE